MENVLASLAYLDAVQRRDGKLDAAADIFDLIFST
jgi:hypothetical protein